MIFSAAKRSLKAKGKLIMLEPVTSGGLKE